VTALRALLEERAPRAGSTRVIGIDGHGGSGKSTLADYLGGRLGAETVHTDDFASWDNPKDWWPLVLARVLEPLRSGARTLSYPRSQWWPGHRPDPVVDQPVTDILILEGVGSLRREFRPYLSVALFVDAPRALCIERGLSRDAALGTTNELLDRWNAWFDDEIVHLARHESRQFADLVLDGTVPFEGQLDS
jgi:uridine kinase